MAIFMTSSLESVRLTRPAEQALDRFTMLVVSPRGDQPGWQSGEDQAGRPVRHVRKDRWKADFQEGNSS
jgi:hypothetical protein